MLYFTPRILIKFSAAGHLRAVHIHLVYFTRKGGIILLFVSGSKWKEVGLVGRSVGKKNKL